MGTLRMSAEVNSSSRVIGWKYNQLEKEDNIIISRIVRKTKTGFEATNPGRDFVENEKISVGDEIEFSGEGAAVIKAFKHCTAKE